MGFASWVCRITVNRFVFVSKICHLKVALVSGESNVYFFQTVRSANTSPRGMFHDVRETPGFMTTPWIDYLASRRATPVRCAASATALATAGTTALLKTVGVM